MLLPLGSVARRVRGVVLLCGVRIHAAHLPVWLGWRVCLVWAELDLHLAPCQGQWVPGETGFPFWLACPDPSNSEMPCHDCDHCCCRNAEPTVAACHQTGTSAERVHSTWQRGGRERRKLHHGLLTWRDELSHRGDVRQGTRRILSRTLLSVLHG